MIKRLSSVVALATVAFGAMAASAGAAPSEDSKKAFPVMCTSGTFAGQTLTVAGGKTVYTADGTQLRVATFFATFGDKTIDKGKAAGSLSCGGSETSPEGTFTFFATFNVVD